MGGNTSKHRSLSTDSEDVTTTLAQAETTQPRRRIVQNYLLIWLDAHIDESENNCQYTLKQLRKIVNDINLFTSPDQCTHFLSQIDKEMAFMIISGALSEHLVPAIHGMTHVDSIYIFCNRTEKHAQWVKEWSKVRGVYNNITHICEALLQAIKQCNQDSIPVSFVSTTSGEFSRNLDELEPSFMYTQIFKEILFDLEYDQQSVNQLAAYCSEKYVDNVNELDIIQKFAREYRPDTSIYWYTRECFILQMLNRALRTLESDTVMKMSFFIRDLHLQIEKLHRVQFGKRPRKAFIVYRGQGLSSQDFAKLQKTKGGLMSFNNFLSTSKKKDVSLGFAKGALKKSETVGILFKMTIDLSISSAPFAVIDKVSFFKEEQEFLFTTHAVFRVGEIETIDNNDRLYKVELQLMADNDSQLCTLAEQIRKETFSNKKGWCRIGELLINLGQFDKAEQVYSIVLQETTADEDKANIFHQLARINNGQGAYEEALSYHREAFRFYEKTLPRKHPLLAASYNDIGLVYNNMREYSKSLSSYEKSLSIRQKTLPPDHPDLAISYNHIALAYYNMEEYSKALSFYEKSLEMYEKTLSSNHPDLAASHNNIGLVYHNMGEYAKALSSFEKSLEIRQKTLPPDHPDLAISHNNIGLAYYNIEEYSKALSSYEKSLAIRRKTLPPDHLDLATSYNNMGLVYYNMGEYSKALSSYEKSLDIRRKTLPPNHRDLATSHNNIGSVYYSIEEYSKALSSYKKSYDICKKTLPPNHLLLATFYNNSGTVYHNTGEYAKALSSYKKSLEIYDETLSSNHPLLVTSHNNIGSLYDSMEEYSKALSS
jgi:tetratricopeptide (TPR) repeat protein